MTDGTCRGLSQYDMPEARNVILSAPRWRADHLIRTSPLNRAY